MLYKKAQFIFKNIEMVKYHCEVCSETKSFTTRSGLKANTLKIHNFAYQKSKSSFNYSYFCPKVRKIWLRYDFNMHRLLVHNAELKSTCKAKKNCSINKKQLWALNFKIVFTLFFFRSNKTSSNASSSPSSSSGSSWSQTAES